MLLANLERFRIIGKFRKPIFFAPYCHEFFSGEDSLTSYSMANGLNEVKIVARKQFIGQTNLLDFASYLSGMDGYVVPKSGSVAQISLRSRFPFRWTASSHALSLRRSKGCEAVQDRRPDL